ncbi:hypothetical protein DLM75_17060 [Leptospira stimsonii]|uniref:Uncharacterized protein n=1 Tax=Leptospira stimsonii TaxID=2202203 RepID=A0A396Z0M2_9LEPT|nr:hypothetical protein DLM75_17060 [Leptospira stimsonii]
MKIEIELMSTRSKLPLKKNRLQKDSSAPTNIFRSFPLKTMQIELKIATLILMIGAFTSFSNCEKDKKEDLTPLLALAATQKTVDLPQPALNTASLKLGDVQYTLTNVLICTAGVVGGGFTIGQSAAEYPPGLNVHNIDPSKNTITIGAGGSQMDIDTTIGVYMAGKNKVAGSCTATVKENSATVYDLQLIDCPVTDELNGQGGNPPDTTVSFRARCRKQ